MTSLFAFKGFKLGVLMSYAEGAIAHSVTTYYVIGIRGTQKPQRLKFHERRWDEKPATILSDGLRFKLPSAKALIWMP